MVAIIDYGMGNVASVQKALNFLNIENCITNNHQEIKDATSILLPGVGSFYQGMKNLKELGLDELLTDEVFNKKKKFLGICLGMQLILEKGMEPEETKGLGWIQGSVVKFEMKDLSIPHMGWNNILIKNPCFFDNCESLDFYFIHSYHAVPINKDDIAATVEYGIEAVASIKKDNIFATQFHPEKSQSSGLMLINNYLKE